MAGLEQLLQDVRCAARAPGKNPGFHLGVLSKEALPCCSSRCPTRTSTTGELTTEKIVATFFDWRTDPWTFAGVALNLALAAAACWMPARRAAQADPMNALRAG